MKRHFCSFALLALWVAAPVTSPAQEPAPPPPPPASLADEVRAIHLLLEQQAKRLDTMAEQISQLRQHPGEATAPTPGSVGTTAPIENTPGPAAETPPLAHPEATPAEMPAPRAEATGGGIKHLVVKGETLTSIAKHYNVPLAELQKANKNLNERKLQIGQLLNIPSAAASESTPSTEKKETP